MKGAVIFALSEVGTITLVGLGAALLLTWFLAQGTPDAEPQPIKGKIQLPGTA